MEEFVKSKRTLFNLVTLIILVVALPIGINLVRQQQIFRSRASALPIEVIEGDCVEERNGKKVLICSEVPLKLTSPIGGVKGGSLKPSTSPQPSSSQAACSSNTKTIDGKPVVSGKNFASLQTALDCFKSGSGGAVYLPTGEYRVPQKLRVYSNVTVFGDGMDKTILMLDGSKNDSLIGNDSSKGQSNIVIRDLTLNGPGNRGTNCCHGLKLENLKGGFVINVASDNWGVDGIYLGYKAVGGILKGVEGVRITGCRANNNDRNGISLTQGSFNVIDNCELQNNNLDPTKRASAIDLEPDSGGKTTVNLILNNKVFNNKGNGIGLGPNPNEPDPKGQVAENAVCFNTTKNNDFAGIVGFRANIYVKNDIQASDGFEQSACDGGCASGPDAACNLPANLKNIPPLPPKTTSDDGLKLIRKVLAQNAPEEEQTPAPQPRPEPEQDQPVEKHECDSDEQCGPGMYCDKYPGVFKCKVDPDPTGSRTRSRKNNDKTTSQTKTKDKKSTTSQTVSSPMPTPSSLPTQSVSNNAAPSPTLVPTPAPLVTLSFKLAETEAGLAQAQALSYDEEPTIYNYQLTDEKVGIKQIWVEFENSEGRKFRSKIIIELAQEDPQIDEVSCRLDISSENVVFSIQGQRFGRLEGSKLTSEDSILQLLEWREDSVLAILEKPNLSLSSQRFNIRLTRADGQESEIVPCSIGLAQLSLGTQVFCKEKGKQEIAAVEVIFVSETGEKALETSSIDSSGLLALKTKLEAGKKYLVSIKPPGALRRNALFRASVGTAVVKSVEGEKFVIPIGDIAPSFGDGAINSADRVELTRQWTDTSKNLSGDFNQDGKVNSVDWACMREGFGEVDEPLPNLIP